MVNGMSIHRSRATNHLKAVQATAAALRDEYQQPSHDRAVVADLNANITRGLKIAEVEAILAVAEQLEQANRRRAVDLPERVTMTGGQS